MPRRHSCSENTCSSKIFSLPLQAELLERLVRCLCAKVRILRSAKRALWVEFVSNVFYSMCSDRLWGVSGRHQGSRCTCLAGITRNTSLIYLALLSRLVLGILAGLIQNFRERLDNDVLTLVTGRCCPVRSSPLPSSCGASSISATAVGATGTRKSCWRYCYVHGKAFFRENAYYDRC
jgi:hypothetical protein